MAERKKKIRSIFPIARFFPFESIIIIDNK